MLDLHFPSPPRILPLLSSPLSLSLPNKQEQNYLFWSSSCLPHALHRGEIMHGSVSLSDCAYSYLSRDAGEDLCGGGKKKEQV